VELSLIAVLLWGRGVQKPISLQFLHTGRQSQGKLAGQVDCPADTPVLMHLLLLIKKR
jgi:hypothetical protein